MITRRCCTAFLAVFVLFSFLAAPVLAEVSVNVTPMKGRIASPFENGKAKGRFGVEGLPYAGGGAGGARGPGVLLYDNSPTGGSLPSGTTYAYVHWTNTLARWGDDLESITGSASVTQIRYFYLNNSATATHTVRIYDMPGGTHQPTTGTLTASGFGSLLASVVVPSQPTGANAVTLTGLSIALPSTGVWISFGDVGGSTFWLTGGVPTVGTSHYGLFYDYPALPYWVPLPYLYFSGTGYVTPNVAVELSGTVGPQADKVITKTDNLLSATPGGQLTYTIVASNGGPTADPSVSVTDTFPSELTCSWTSSPAGGATGNSNSSGNLSDTLNMPASSSVTYTVTCDIDPAATGTLSNTANISTGTVTDPLPGNNSDTDDDTVLNAEADLAMSKTTDAVVAELMVGDLFDYVLEVTNAGPSDATNVVVNDILSPELDFVGSDCGMVEGPPGELTWSVGTLVAGASATCTLTVEINTFSNTVSNNAAASSDAADNNPDDNFDGDLQDGVLPVIPTLAPWGLGLLLLVLAGVGGWRLRRR